MVSTAALEAQPACRLETKTIDTSTKTPQGVTRNPKPFPNDVQYAQIHRFICFTEWRLKYFF